MSTGYIGLGLKAKKEVVSSASTKAEQLGCDDMLEVLLISSHEKESHLDESGCYSPLHQSARCQCSLTPTIEKTI